MRLTSLHDFYCSWHLYICRSLFGHSTFFVTSLVFMKGTSCCVILLWQGSIGHMSLRGVWHLCNLLCVYALFWLFSVTSYVFKSPSICFQGTKHELTLKMLFTFYVRTPGSAVIRTVCKYSTVVNSYHEYHIWPCMFFFGDVVALPWDSYSFVWRHFNLSCCYLIELMFLELDL